MLSICLLQINHVCPTFAYAGTADRLVQPKGINVQMSTMKEMAMIIAYHF